jgi:lysozyme
MSNHPEGIDVSDNNGPDFNWAEWKEHIQFGMAKATEGLYFLDPTFKHNWDAMKILGIYRFAYHFAHTNEDPAGQALSFTRYVREHGLVKHDHFVLDLDEVMGGMTPEEVSFWAWTFCTEMNRLNPGHRILVYVNESMASECYCAQLGNWELWAADPGAPAPRMPWGPWKAWTMFQYSWSITDRDRFWGTDDELQRFCEHSGPEGFHR